MFAHTCSHCGVKSREVDFIVGDGIYQCWFANREACEARHARLTPEEWITLPKSFALQRYSKAQLMLLAMNKDPLSGGSYWREAANRVYGNRSK